MECDPEEDVRCCISRCKHIGEIPSMSKDNFIQIFRGECVKKKREVYKASEYLAGIIMNQEEQLKAADTESVRMIFAFRLANALLALAAAASSSVGVFSAVSTSMMRPVFSLFLTPPVFCWCSVLST